MDHLKEFKDGIKVYEDPIDKHLYVMCVDVSRGQGIDYHAAVVIDITESPYKVVATFRNNEIPPMVLPNLLDRMGRKYNEAYCLVEVNDIGGQVADIMHSEIEYENMLYTSVRGHRGQELGAGFGVNARLGVKTSASIKRLGCSTMKTMIEEDKLIVQDYSTIEELSTFVAKRGTYAADSGHHDDMVMTLVLFGWMTSQPHFKEISDMNIREDLFKEKISELEDGLTPFGIIDMGIEEQEYEVDSDGDVWFKAEDDPYPW